MFKGFKGFGLGIFLIAIVLVSLYFKSWQCAEMFPNANRWACIMWSK